ncbi:MAG: tRNA uridine-5-carboxymethylaminomethyl(34) synthesis GTPase MnmE [Phycisphaerae bacterium]|nr:tRNA uridine-5-carboxymethylaminomethyl(34) synthesis GTPase MnmE [Phycisphaerae bacterium]
MLNMDDTIAAVSSPSVPYGIAARSIVRLSGPDTYHIISQCVSVLSPIKTHTIIPCQVHVDDELSVRGLLYAFFHPASYTGQDLVELHLDMCSAVVEAVLKKIYRYARPAAPGEFTQRAFLNGKLDLTQAEAVAEIVSSANSAQLAAAQRLLHGRFSDVIADLREQLIALIGNLEAGLDFSEENIEFVTADAALATIEHIRQSLTGLLEDSIRCERMIDLDAVGLAGLPNAGKSSLLNALLGHSRSIVSETESTTRDVLTGLLRLQRLDCILFDCAGLLSPEKQATLIDRLSHQASLTALNKVAVVLFCVDLTRADVSADIQMQNQIDAETIVYVATKADLLSEKETANRLADLEKQFKTPFILTSVRTGQGLELIKSRIEAVLTALRAGDRDHQDRLTINQRHEQRLREAVKLLAESADEIRSKSVEIAAMLLRQAYELLGGLERENISETILDHIFSRFCIGK